MYFVFVLSLFCLARSINQCLGTGLDTTTVQPTCLASIYLPTDDTTFSINIPESQLIEFSVVMQSYFNINAYYHHKTSSSGFLGFGSKSKEVYRFYSNYYREQKSLTKIVLTLAFTEEIAPVIPFPLNQMNKIFIDALNKLPPYDPTNNESDVMYTEFIMTWGTAVIDEVVLGGEFESNIWYDNMFNSIYTESKIEESSHWSFMGLIGGGHGKSDHSVFVDKKFNATMVTDYYYLGGNVTMQQNQYLDWAATVRSNQQVIKYHLVPLTYFIHNSTISHNIDRAINDYAKRADTTLNAYIASLKHRSLKIEKRTI